jgi:phosphoglycerate dehydrogenase-like enzyme
VQRIQQALPNDAVVNAQQASVRAMSIADAEILLATSLTVDEYRSAPRLKWVHSTAVGVARLLPPPVVDSELVVTNSRGIHSDTIAEHAIAVLLAVRRSIHVAGVRQQAREWAQVELSTVEVPPLVKTTVIVVGLGTIGARIARLAAGLGMRVIGVRKRLALPRPDGVSDVVATDQLIDVLPDADAIVLAIPRTHDNRVLLGDRELAAMKASAVLINIARGQLVDERALLSALANGRLRAAGLDAFHQEPLPRDSPLWSLPNVLITPHTAAFDGDYWTPVVDLFLDNVKRFRSGETLRNVVDKKRGY